MPTGGRTRIARGERSVGDRGRRLGALAIARGAEEDRAPRCAVERGDVVGAGRVDPARELPARPAPCSSKAGGDPRRRGCVARLTGDACERPQEEERVDVVLDRRPGDVFGLEHLAQSPSRVDVVAIGAFAPANETVTRIARLQDLTPDQVVGRAARKSKGPIARGTAAIGVEVLGRGIADPGHGSGANVRDPLVRSG